MTFFRHRSRGKSDCLIVMQIFIQDFTVEGGRTFTLEVRSDETIATVVDRLLDRKGLGKQDREVFRKMSLLRWSTKQLDAKKTLNDYNIHKDSTIQVDFRLANGGCYR